MCVVLVYFLTLRITIFRKILAGELYFLLLKVDHAQTKSGNGAIGFQRI